MMATRSNLPTVCKPSTSGIIPYVGGLPVEIFVIASRYGNRAMVSEAASPILILHLSDIHFRIDRAWDSDPVLRALVEFIKDEVKTVGKPDLVAITGDLACSGRAEEYELAFSWLRNELWPVLAPKGEGGLEWDRLLLVPGNHDIDRARVSLGAHYIKKGLLDQGKEAPAKGQEAIAAVLTYEKTRDLLLDPYHNWLKFCGSWLCEPQALPWWQRTIPIKGQRLHLAGLDSAWLAYDDNDYGRLLLGDHQVSQTVLHQDGQGADWRLALLHHPWGYLAEHDGDASCMNLHRNRDLLLRGHRHDEKAFFVEYPDSKRNCLELAAGCVYGSSRYPNAFHWIELHPKDAKGNRLVRVLFRAWVDGNWQIDSNKSGTENRTAEFTFRQTGGTGHETGSQRPPAPDMRRYLEYILEKTAYIEIPGLPAVESPKLPIGDLIELRDANGRPLVEKEGGGTAWQDRRLVIQGEPGCGKTTLMRWVAHCLASDQLGHEHGAAGRYLGLDWAPLPILVPITLWLNFMEREKDSRGAPGRENSWDWLPIFLGHYAKEFGLDAETFRRLFRDGQALILLDGLDETPDRRDTAALIIAEVAHAWSKCPVIVTSRPQALARTPSLPGFVHSSIKPLDDSAIAAFLGRWSRALFGSDSDRAETHRHELVAAFDSRPEIRRLARNATMLTLLLVVHRDGKRLPEQRAELYDCIIDWLLQARKDRAHQQRPERRRELLAELALAMQRDERGRKVQVRYHAAARLIADHFPATGPSQPEPTPEQVKHAAAFVAQEERDSGIVVRHDHELKFWHLTFQEYLAACALADRPDAERTALLFAPVGDPLLYRAEWRETVLLLGGALCRKGEKQIDGLVTSILDDLGLAPIGRGPVSRLMKYLPRSLFRDPVGGRAAQARAAGLIGALVVDLTPFGYHPADPRYEQIITAARAVFDPRQATAIPLGDRIAAAEALAQIGDRRLHWNRPDRWVEVPGGRFLMGAQKSDPAAPGYDQEIFDDESPVHEVSVGPFRIGRFPVTVAEFGEFLDDEECGDPRWWPAGRPDESLKPDGWEEEQAHPSRPVVSVSWFQAAAYCAWLTDQLRRRQGTQDCLTLPAGWGVRLPTEAEWELAARGPAGRYYPWGTDAPDADRVNDRNSRVGHPSPVGIFPGDVTPEGVLDLAGNVQEWCLDSFSKDFYARCAAEGCVADPMMVPTNSGLARVARGASFYHGTTALRASMRSPYLPLNRARDVGFRCALAARRPSPADEDGSDE